jgi:hypothetical protein
MGRLDMDTVLGEVAKGWHRVFQCAGQGTGRATSTWACHASFVGASNQLTLRKGRSEARPTLIEIFFALLTNDDGLV